MSKFKRFGPESGGEFKLATKASTGKVYIDYKNIEPLRRMMSPNGKILTRKRTGLNSYEQRMLAGAIKRARYMALLPYTSATV